MAATSSPIDGAENEKAKATCTVYYDGACPLCQREIAMYQGMDGAETIRWHDVSVSGTGSDDLATQDAMARFHVRRADGSLVSGARGFFEVMKTIPKLRWLGQVLSVPPIPWIAEGAYRLFLPLRPFLKRIIPAPKTRPRNDA
jgi:predicted DCC family thiol-disulfide oxidoreductase YuxK